MTTTVTPDPGADLLTAVNGDSFGCILADPPWQFVNRTGKMAPEHKRLSRYGTLDVGAICALPVAEVSAPTSHLYLWVPNALLPEGLRVMTAWGFTYKSNIVWHKRRKDGGSDGRGVGFYFRNVTELVLFGVRGKNARTLQPGRTQVNYLGTRKREHSRKPDEIFDIIEACSPGPRIELFARGVRSGWKSWGDQASGNYAPSWPTYRHNSASGSQQCGPTSQLPRNDGYSSSSSSSGTERPCRLAAFFACFSAAMRACSTASASGPSSTKLAGLMANVSTGHPPPPPPSTLGTSFSDA